MGWVYFKSEDEGDGTYDGQIGRVHLELDVDGPTREEWERIGAPRRSFLSRLLGR
jgi:hypothetical protein